MRNMQASKLFSYPIIRSYTVADCNQFTLTATFSSGLLHCVLQSAFNFVFIADRLKLFHHQRIDCCEFTIFRCCNPLNELHPHNLTKFATQYIASAIIRSVKQGPPVPN